MSETNKCKSVVCQCMNDDKNSEVNLAVCRKKDI